jgi:hypothetical protein
MILVNIPDADQLRNNEEFFPIDKLIKCVASPQGYFI